MPPFGAGEQSVPAAAAQSASVVQSKRALLGHAPLFAVAQVGLLPAWPPTQHTWPTAQLVVVQGGGVHTRLALAPPPPPPKRGAQVLPVGQSASVAQTWR